jgi:threonine/homoserine/homoserine lactone efflux protein
MLIFFTTLLISFLGSIHPGPLNVSVVEITLKNSLKAGLIMAFGGIIPEFLYSWLAVEGVMFFQRNELIFNIIRWLLVVILISMGVKTMLSKERKVIDKNIEANSFFKGFILSALNPQLLIFWLLIVVYFHGIHWLKIITSFDKICFIFGAGFGAFLLNYLYSIWAFAKKDFIFKHVNQRLFNLLIGGSFIAMALFQLFKLIYD